MPVGVQRLVLWSRQCVHRLEVLVVPQLQFIDLFGFLSVALRQIPMVLSVPKTTEIHQFQFTDKVVEVPSCSCSRFHKCSSTSLCSCSDKFQLSVLTAEGLLSSVHRCTVWLTTPRPSLCNDRCPNSFFPSFLLS